MARRGTKVGIGLGVTLLLLLGALLIADRVAVNAAEAQIASQAKKELVARNITSPSEPNVSIGGFPFLTQVLAGTYEKITLTFDQPEANGVRLRDLGLVASSVHADTQAVLNGTGTVTADRVTGTANLDWDAVRKLIDLARLPNVDPQSIKLTVVNNQIELRLPLTLPTGHSVTLRANGALQVDAGRVRIQLSDLTTEGAALPPAIDSLVRAYIQQNRNRLNATLKVPDMPYQLVVNKIETSEAGILVIASADNVRLAG